MSDPRGPSRTITKVETIDGKVFVTLSICGHRVERVSHFAYHVGDTDRCFKCAQEGK